MNFKKILITFMFLFVPLCGFSQEYSLENAQEYEIAEITVTGAKRYNAQTILTASGLKVGDKIMLPSEKFSSIIHKLWGYKLFTDIDIYISKTEGNLAYLELAIVETPTLSDITITGIKKRKADEIIKEAKLDKGTTKVDESLIAKTKSYITNKYRKTGHFNTKVHIATKEDTTSVNKGGVKMLINIDKGQQVKINQLNFQGNEKFSDSKLRRQLKKTKQRRFGRFWKRSKYVKAKYDEDLASLIDFYKANGYRDARVVSDTLFGVDSKNIALDIKVEEGRKYYFGDIKFLGNTVYNNQTLQNVLGLKKGEVYNGVQLRNRINDPKKPDGNTIANLYQNTGYLFSQINPVEVSAINDTINFEVRIHEGKQAYFNDIIVKGNTITNDKIIYRELRTRPGYLYSKDDIVRTVRELSQLGIFDAQSIAPNIKNPDPNAGTVDIEYQLDDTTSSSQIQLQGGYGGGGFIGTVGLNFNNFSIQNIFDKKSYRPLPMGDGQKLSLNLQASRSYRLASFSFMEPWWGGERPVQFSVSFNYSVNYSYNYYTYRVDRSKSFNIAGINIGLAKRLRVPDDYFQLSQSISYNHYSLHNYNTPLFTFGNGYANSLAYTATLSRRSSGPNPIYPMGGSDFSLMLRLTPPYSLFNGVDYRKLSEERTLAVKSDFPNRVSRIDQERFKWLEYYKIKVSGAWYMNLVDKLVLKTNAEFGFLAAYNSDRGVVPFERFSVGGDGMSYYGGLEGRDYIQLRGYPNQSLSSEDGDTIYNKFSLELRYPITLKPSASIYALAFAEGGNSFNSFGKFSPYELKRSTGLGIRIFMPMFGLLGFDFGYGFDGINGQTKANGWETHFIFGQQF